MAVTLYLEDDINGNQQLYTDLAQVMINRYQLQTINPTLDSQLGLGGGSFSSVVQKSSNVWSGLGDLSTAEENTLITMGNGSANSSACSMFMSALNVANTAVTGLSNANPYYSYMMPGTSVSASTYWFYIPNPRKKNDGNPVLTNLWNTTISQPTIDGWVFETLVGPVGSPPQRSPGGVRSGAGNPGLQPKPPQ